MSLYPSLEDMKVDQIGRAQAQAFSAMQQQQHQFSQVASAPAYTMNPYPEMNPQPASAPTAYPDLFDYMGMELSHDMIAANMPEYLTQRTGQVSAYSAGVVALPTNMVAPLSGNSVGLARAQVTHGVRELILCKDAKGQVGLRAQAINKGLFVSVVVKGTPAALGGLRFGDQILQVNGTVVAGFSVDQVHKLLKKSPVNDISLVIRDRPFERTITLHKDSSNNMGFQFKDGRITAIVKDSSAARNGLLTEHNLLEIEGVNVVAVKDKEINKMISEAPQVVTFTIMPTFIYEHIVKKLPSSLLRGKMDHSVLEI